MSNGELSGERRAARVAAGGETDARQGALDSRLTPHDSLAPLRLGVVGCGGTRQTYGTAIRLVDDVEVTALMDPDPVAARSWVRSARGIPIFTEIEPFLAEAPAEAVLVASPPGLRAAQAAAAARSDRHVLCERPAALKLKDLDEFQRASDESGVVACVGFAKRHDTAFREAADLLAGGAIGDPAQVRCDWTFCAEWEEHRATLKTWAGVFRDLASQTVDVCRWWLGDVHTVSADLDLQGSGSRKREIGNLILNHERGVSVHHLSRTTRRNAVEQYLIRGNRGALQLSMTSGWSYLSDDPFRLVLHRAGEAPQDLTRPAPRRPDEASEHNPYRRLLADFAARVRSGAPDPEALTASRQALEVVYAAYLSSVEKAKLALPLTHPPELGEGW